MIILVSINRLKFSICIIIIIFLIRGILLTLLGYGFTRIPIFFFFFISIYVENRHTHRFLFSREYCFRSYPRRRLPGSVFAFSQWHSRSTGPCTRVRVCQFLSRWTLFDWNLKSSTTISTPTDDEYVIGAPVKALKKPGSWHKVLK